MLNFCGTKNFNIMIRTSLYDHFSQLPDPRLNRNKKHNLTDMIACVSYKNEF